MTSILTTHTYSAGLFNHAAAIVPLGDGIVIAFYGGVKECHESQAVKIFYNENGKINGPLSLEPFTGNPVLYQVTENQANLIYTQFERFPHSPAHWWQYCSIWQRKIIFNGGLLQLSEPKQIIVDEGDIENKPPEGLGYISRCHPIKAGEELLLPLYREFHPQYYGVILTSEDGGETWKFKGTIGKKESNIIQPTLWESDDKIHSLSRNFSMAAGRSKTVSQYAYYSWSEDRGETWAPLSASKHYNFNNSLVVIEQCAIWNHDPRGRKNLVLGTLSGTPLYKIDSYGSYPAACISQDQLHIAYSYHGLDTVSKSLEHPNSRMIIKHKIFDSSRMQTFSQTEKAPFLRAS